MAETQVSFLGEIFLFPEELHDYIYYCRKFQKDRDILLRVICSRIEKKWYDYPDKEFDKLLRDICKDTISYLADAEIYDVTEEDLLSDNKGYKNFLDITRNAFEQFKSFSIDEIREYREGYENAFSSVTAQVTGPGYGLISNSVIAHMTFAAMESYTISKQVSKADKEFKQAMGALANHTHSKKEQREQEFLYGKLYPEYIRIAEIFIAEMIDKYLSLLEAKGVYDYSKVQQFSIDRSTDLLKNINIVKNPKKVLIQAFKNCPYNIKVYQMVVDMDMMDNETKKTLEYYGQKDSLVDLIEKEISEVFNEKDVNVVKTKQEISFLTKLKKKNKEQIENELFGNIQNDIEKNIKKIYEYITDTYEFERMFTKLGGEEKEIYESDMLPYIMSNLKEDEIILYEQICGNDFLTNVFKKYDIPADSLESFKNIITDKLSRKLDVKYTEIREEKKKIEEYNHKRNKIIMLCITIVALSVCTIFIIKAFKENQMNQKQYAMANELLENGKYDEAIAEWKKIEEYKDSADEIKEATYQKGLSLYNEGEYEEAISTWHAIDGTEYLGTEYKDTLSQIDKAKEQLEIIRKQEKKEKISQIQKKVLSTFSNPESEDAKYIANILAYAGEDKDTMEKMGKIDFSQMQQVEDGYEKEGTFLGISGTWKIVFNNYWCDGIEFKFDFVDDANNEAEKKAIDFIGRSYDTEDNDPYLGYYEGTWDCNDIEGQYKFITNLVSINTCYTKMTFHSGLWSK